MLARLVCLQGSNSGGRGSRISKANVAVGAGICGAFEADGYGYRLRKTNAIVIAQKEETGREQGFGADAYGNRISKPNVVVPSPTAAPGREPAVDAADDLALVLLLKSCTTRRDLNKGAKLHAEALKKGLFRNNIFIASTLVNMYAKYGALAKAQSMLEELSERNVVCWNALVSGYAQHGHAVKALVCFGKMQDEGFVPNEVTFACILKACGSLGASQKGGEIHAEIIRQGLLEKNIILGNALVDLYAKCGALNKAQQLFNELSLRNVVSWNALIAGYCENGDGKTALNCYELMQHEGFSPTAVTFLCLLKACASLGSISKGSEIHSEIVRQRLLGTDVELGNALVDMYAKCGALAKAKKVFDELPVRDIVAWTALIAGYYQHGQGEEALDCFERMKHEGLFPDTISFLCAVKACSSVGAAEKGQLIHAEIIKKRHLRPNNILGNALVDMYGKCGLLSHAQRAFDELPVHDKVSWTSLIGGYCDHGCNREAVSWFSRMKDEGCLPDSVTFDCILKASKSV